MEDPVKVAVIGLGKLGVCQALLFAEAGLDVMGIDISPDHLAKLKAGEAPHHEPGLVEMLAEHGPKIDWRSDPADAAECDVAFVVVPTPSLPSGAFDVSAVESVLACIDQTPRNGVSPALCCVSTTNPGDCTRIAQGLTAPLVYSPEFVALGDVLAGMRRPDLTLIGETERWAGDKVLTCLRAIKPGHPADLHDGQTHTIRPPSIHRLSLTEAEIAKLSVNAYVTMKISFANTLGELCEIYGARGESVARAIGADSRIGAAYLRPGRAYGGPCFPRDNAALIEAAPLAMVPMDLASATEAVNAMQVDRFAELVVTLSDEWARVAVLGMAYKPGTGVTEQSFGQSLAWQLEGRDRQVTSWDPLVRTSWATLEDAVKGADVVVIANDDPAFVGPFPGAIIVDCMGLAGLDLTGCKRYIRAGDGTTM
jgi:UDPglucose 6-dehydrogenase